MERVDQRAPEHDRDHALVDLAPVLRGELVDLERAACARGHARDVDAEEEVAPDAGAAGVEVALGDLVAGGVAQARLQRALEAGADAGDLDRVVDDVMGARVAHADERGGHGATLTAAAAMRSIVPRYDGRARASSSVDRALPSGGRSRGFESLLARLQLAIISDTHMPKGARALPEACIDRLRAADAILHAGDLIALEVLELLESLGPPRARGARQRRRAGGADAAAGACGSSRPRARGSS